MINRQASSYDVIVKIKSRYRTFFAFGTILAGEPIAIILSFTGFESEVIGILQNLSHNSRAFIC